MKIIKQPKNLTKEDYEFEIDTEGKQFNLSELKKYICEAYNIINYYEIKCNYFIIGENKNITIFFDGIKV